MSEQDPQDAGGQAPQGQGWKRDDSGRWAGPQPNSFEPGQSGNPGGMVKATISPTRILHRMLAEQPNEHNEGKLAVALAQRWLEIALQGDEKVGLAAVKEALDRTDGLPVKEVKHSGDMKPVLLRERPPSDEPSE